MNALRLLILLCFASPVISVADDQISPSLQSLENYSVQQNSVDAARIEAIRENGVRVGVQAGMIARGKEIALALDYRAAQLDRIFEFQPLMDRNGFLPPVITEVTRHVDTLHDAQRIEYAGVVYKIFVPARFVRIVPTWRDYLLTGLADPRLKVESLPEAIRPKTDSEKMVWRNAVDSGWKSGIEQSDRIFAENVSRLSRDYVGMFRYVYLLNNGMIKAPVLSMSPDGVHVSDDEIAIGVGAKVIEQRSIMERNSSVWGTGP